MGPTGDNFRILQIHPTRRCNLRCLHCYSSSGPQEGEDLDPSLLRSAILDAAALGYNVASFAGGEPIMYPQLHELLDAAHGCGMITTAVSNGLLLDARRLPLLQARLDLLAISLDGIPESHNRIRASRYAFEIMASRLDGLRRSGIPFGFVFTLTHSNLDEMEWVATFAVEQGAALLQIHPLEEAGRARLELRGQEPNDVQAAWAWLETLRLRHRYGGRLRIQLDLVDREVLRAVPSRVFADDAQTEDPFRPLADLISPLIIEADGTVVPLQYGLDRTYALGNLRDSSLACLAGGWRVERQQAFRTLCRRTLEEITNSDDLPIVDWYREVARRAGRDRAGVSVARAG